VPLVTHLVDHLFDGSDVPAVAVHKNDPSTPRTHRPDHLDEYYRKRLLADRHCAGKSLMLTAGAIGQGWRYNHWPEVSTAESLGNCYRDLFGYEGIRRERQVRPMLLR
jgi:hypothetical protein